MSINRVSISGNLTRNAELRGSQEGKKILKFCVAVNDRQRNRETGEWEDHPNFVDCVLFGTRAEKLSDALSKGVKVALDGKLHWSQWATKDGTKRSTLEVYVEEIEFFAAKQAAKQDEGGYYLEDCPF